MSGSSNLPTFLPPLFRHPLASLITLLFITLAIIYSLVTPPFEAGDESRHYAVVKYMVETGQLPVQHVPETAAIQHHWSHEGSQPPLYYGLAAALTFWIDTGDWDEVFWYNPHTTIGNPLRPDNKNITIHPPGEAWPWRGHVLAVHLIRFLSITMATVTVIAAYAIALRLFQGNRWLAAGAMAITAFNPMFIFISASVNNDNAVIMFVTLALYVMIHLGERRAKNSKDDKQTRTDKRTNESVTSAPLLLRSPALLGLLIGLGALSKLYAIGLLPLAILLFFWLAYRRSSSRESLFTNSQFPISPSPNLPISPLWGPFLLWSATLIAVFLVVAGWFYLRNALLYHGDFLALQVMRETAGQRREAPSWHTLRAEFEGFRIAYWALFGGVNILADNWLYRVLDLVSLVAAAGVVTYIIRFWILDLGFWIYSLLTKRSVSGIPHPASRFTPHSSRTSVKPLRGTHHVSRFTLLLLLAWYLIILAGFIVWNLTQPAGQGRLMYPAIAAISALGMLGLTWWLPPRGQKVVSLLSGLGLFLFAAVSPFLYILPAYASPPILSQTDLPTDLQRVDFIYEGKLRLLGYQLHTPVVRPAETLRVTLYWQLLEPTPLDYSIFMHLLGRQRAVIGQIDTYPGGGKWPTTLLQPGDILADTYQAPITPAAEFEHAPARLQIAAGIYDFNEPGRPGKAAVDAAGQPVEPIIAGAKLIPWQWPDPPVMAQPINFFDKATLLSYKLAQDQTSLTLNWRAEQRFETDYTVFIQAWRADTQEYVTGFDGPPVGGDYPTTLWAPGEIIVDRRRLDLTGLSPGNYYLLAGLYNPTTGDRLPAFTPTGPLPDYAVRVGELHLVKESSAR